MKTAILHPGAMGVSIAATMHNTGHTVYWASQGRGPATGARAADHAFTDAGTLAALVKQVEAIVCVCPPHAAADVADAVIAEGFNGLYVDANAIAPQKAQGIGQKCKAAGMTFVDGGIIGGPAWEPGRTWLYLSGTAAGEALPLFAAGPLETEIVGEEVGQASALKMCFAAFTKGSTALLCAVIAAAEQLGVRDALERDWARRDPEVPEQRQASIRYVTAKAWRFAGEMEEIAATFRAAGVPDGFHLAANEIYRRIAGFKDTLATPALADVLEALLARDQAR